LAKKHKKPDKIRATRKNQTRLTDSARSVTSHAYTPSQRHSTGVGLVPKSRNSVRTINLGLLRQSMILLAFAAVVFALLAAVFLLLPDGKAAVSSIGGLAETVAPMTTAPLERTAQITVLLDTLFPILYGSGLAVFATALQSRGNRPLVRLILTALFVVVVTDISENAIIKTMMNGGAPLAVQPLFTMVKYAGLGFASVMLSAIVPRIGFWGQFAHFLLLYAFPISIAALVAGIGGETVQAIASGIMFATLIVLALFARNLSSGHGAQIA